MLRRDFISIGTHLQVEIAGLEDRFRSVLIGIDPDHYLVIKTPIALSAGMIRSCLLSGATIIIRYVFAGSAWGFQCQILQTLTGNIQVIFVSYPETVENHDLRSNDRIDCLIPADVTADGRVYPGVMTDLSQTGSRLLLSSVKNSGVEHWMPELGCELALELQLPGAAVPAPASAILRNLSRDGERVLLGLQFNRLDDSAQQALTGFLDEIRARMELR